MEDNISLRLKTFITYLGVNDSAFADNCGISRSTLSLILSGRNKKVNDQQLAQIHTAYPQLSMLWLMFGEGPMLLENSQEDHSGQNVDKTTGEILEFASNGPQITSGPILNALTESEIANNQLSENNLKLLKKIEDLESKIAKLESEPRKVVKITIFYDDSTFDSFVPEK